MDFSELLKPYLKKTNKTYYVALSGGVDSFVLLNELLKIRENCDLKLSAIHINHNIQKDSLKWKNFCSEFCRKNHIKYFSRTLRKRTDFSNLEKKLGVLPERLTKTSLCSGESVAVQILIGASS